MAVMYRIAAPMTCLRNFVLLHGSTFSHMCSAPFQQVGRIMSADSGSAIIVPMPKLSPSMTAGTISKWVKAPGDEVAEYDIVMEVDTEELTENAYKVGKFAGNVTLLVEAQEEGVMHSHLVPEGKQVKVGTPVALMAEQRESLPELDGFKPPEDVYAEKEAVRTLIWQSFLKSDDGDPTKSCS